MKKILCATGLVLALSTAARAEPKMTLSADGTPISYEVYGKGEPALVFIHGWSCDSRYWREQVPYFSKKHRVLTVDLAGHGHSGLGRARYTPKAFGEDVKAAMEAAGVGKAILVGHSMGGPIAAEAARLMPGKVLGIVGADTFDSIDYPLKQEELDGMLGPMKKDFPAGCRAFVEPMLSTRTAADLREWVVADMCAAPPSAAVGAMEEMFAQFLKGESGKVYEGLAVPIRSVNGELWPIDFAAARRHMGSFEAVIIKGADHFLMLARPTEFNRELEKAVKILSRRTP